MSTCSGTAYQDPIADPVIGSMDGQLVDVTAVERPDGVSSNADGLHDLIDANGQTSPVDAGDHTHPTDADGQNQVSSYLGPTDAAGINQGLTHLGPDEERDGVGEAHEAPTRPQLTWSFDHDEQHSNSNLALPVAENNDASVNNDVSTLNELAGFVHPPTRRLAPNKDTNPRPSNNINPSRFFPHWFGHDPTPDLTTHTGIEPPQNNPSRWGDFDGSEHPFGEIPEGWTDPPKPPEINRSTGKGKVHTPKVAQSHSDELYARFMASIVDGLDDKTQKLIRDWADKMKNIALGSDVDTNSTNTPKNKHTVYNENTATEKIIHVHTARDTGLLPDIFALRRTTPGGEPRVPDVPKTAHNPIDQIPTTSYIAQQVRGIEKVDSNLSDAPTSSTDGTPSQKSARKARKWKAYRHREQIRIEEATKVKIDPPQPYDGSSDFDAFERWTYAVNAWFEITEFPKRHRVRQMLAFMRGRAQQYYMTFVAPDVKEWTVETVGQGLFNYCFPPAFRRQTRMKFNELTQGKRTVWEYLRHLRSIAARLPDMNEFQLTQILGWCKFISTAQVD